MVVIVTALAIEIVIQVANYIRKVAMGERLKGKG
jgi:hypothetical protein